MFPRHNGFHGPSFPSTRVTMQSGLVSTTLFNLVVYNVIRTWLAMTMENQRVAHFGLVETVGRCLGVLYAYDGMVVSQEPDWLQHSMNVLAGLFRRYGLAYNFVKSHTMTFQSGILRSGMSEKAKSLKCTGVGYSYRVRLRSCIPCPEC